MKHKKKEGTAKVVNVAVQATFTKALLTAENDMVNYVALYSDSDAFAACDGAEGSDI